MWLMGLESASPWLRTKWNKMDLGGQLKGHVVSEPHGRELTKTALVVMKAFLPATAHFWLAIVQQSQVGCCKTGSMGENGHFLKSPTPSGMLIYVPSNIPPLFWCFSWENRRPNKTDLVPSTCYIHHLLTKTKVSVIEALPNFSLRFYMAKSL